MPLDYPTYDELVSTARASLRNNIPGLDPTIANGFAVAWVDSCAALAHSNNLQIRDLETELFPQTASDEFLDRWLGYEGLDRNPARGGRGPMTITGNNGSVVPVEAKYTGSNGLVYKTQEVAAIVDTTLIVDSLTRTGTTATASFIESHGLASGNTPTISGVDQPEYNGTFEITVISGTEFTYTVSGSPATPATGAILTDSTYSTIIIECESTGIDTNLEAGAVLTINVPISGVDDISTIGAEGVTGGADVEGDDSARRRLLLSRAARDGVFTSDQIRLAALSISGNTRVFVIEPELPVLTDRPVAGQVFIYFLRDSDPNPIPSSTIIEETKQAIVEDGSMPAHTIEDDVVVRAPIPLFTDYTFSSISPDTITMRQAIENQLSAFYQDSVQFEEDITESNYLGTISNTIDTQTGTVLESFSLSSPSGNISIGFGEIGFLGTVSFL